MKPQIFKEVEEELKDCKEMIPCIVASLGMVLNRHGYTSGFEFRGFNRVVEGKRWIGIVYLERNSIMGSVFGFFDRKPFVLRGYPKIKYSDESGVLNNEVVAEEKIDGTNIGVYALPNGKILCKTRRSEEAGVYDGRNFQALMEEVDVYSNLTKLARDGYVVYGELYGNRNRGEFVKYDIPIAYKVFDIVDVETHRFLGRKEVEDLCLRYELPIVDVVWKGILTKDDYEELRDYLSERKDIEGLVAKLDTVEDRVFGKIKSEDIMERCLEESMGAIPKPIIRKAIRKAIDEGKRYEEVHSFVVGELGEEFTERLIGKSEQRIWALIKEMYRIDDYEEMVHYAIGKIREGYEKRDVMRMLNDRFHDDPSVMFRAYQVALNHIKKDGNSCSFA